MASRIPLVLNSGNIQQLQAGDTLSAQVDTNVLSRTNANAGTLAIGTPVYITIADATKVDKCDASSTGIIGKKERCIGLVTSALTSGATGQVQTGGILTLTTAQWDAVTGDSGGLTVGSYYFLDPANVGKLRKDGNGFNIGTASVRVGVGLNTTDFLIHIERTVIT